MSLVPKMVLRDTMRPCASNDRIAVVADLVMMLPLTSPETFSSQIPLPPLPVAEGGRGRLLEVGLIGGASSLT